MTKHSLSVFAKEEEISSVIDTESREGIGVDESSLLAMCDKRLRLNDKKSPIK